jgi:hypothetical protein
LGNVASRNIVPFVIFREYLGEVVKLTNVQQMAL